MSPSKDNAQFSGARGAVRQAAARLRPIARKVRPLASRTGAAASQQVRRTRAWAAPRVERSGHAIEHTVAPKVSAMMSSAAQRIEPAASRQRRWRTPAGLATLTAASGAVTAFVRGRMRRASGTPADQPGSDDVIKPAPLHDVQPPASPDTDAATGARAS